MDVPGEYLRREKVRFCVEDLYGEKVGTYYCNPLMDTQEYDLEYDDRTHDRYFAYFWKPIFMDKLRGISVLNIGRDLKSLEWWNGYRGRWWFYNKPKWEQTSKENYVWVVVTHTNEIRVLKAGATKGS